MLDVHIVKLSVQFNAICAYFSGKLVNFGIGVVEAASSRLGFLLVKKFFMGATQFATQICATPVCFFALIILLRGCFAIILCYKFPYYNKVTKLLIKT